MLYMYLLVFILGACLASFIHVYVTRLLKGESIVKPASHCPVCNHKLKWYELVPVLSYIVQRGRCNKCNSKIGIDSFLVELITGILFVIVFCFYGISYSTLLGFVIVLVLISVLLSDFKEMIILDSTIIVGVILTYLIVFLDLGWRGIYKSFMYGVFAFVLMFLVKIIGDKVFKRESLGGGDIKLAFLMGSILSYNLFLMALVSGSCLALPYALYISLTRKTGELAYGPFLVMGLLIVFLFQNGIIELLNMLTGA